MGQTSPLSPAAPIKLLIVDDDDVWRERLRRLITRSGLPATVSEAADGSEAFEKLAEDGYDCVILDYFLGDRTGVELMRMIRSEGRRPCAVIMVTAQGNEGVAVEAMREGVYDYLPKTGLDSQRLGTAIEGCLKRTELERQLRETQHRLRYLSMYDGLTGLPNRNLFLDRLEQTLLAADRGGPAFTLMMLDLNLFKEINDRLGHAAGDQVLLEVGNRLKHLARKSDSFARIGGDEFAGLLIGTISHDGVIHMAEKICAAIREPMPIGDTVVSIGASVGIVTFPIHGRDGRTLLARADSAMYLAKRGSRGYEIHGDNGALADEGGNPLLLAAHLSEGLLRQEFYLHYQPQVDLKTGVLVGIEALLRWSSQRLGAVSPADFIPVAERSPVINPLTYLVINMALDQVRRWHDLGWIVPVSVNLSPRLFDDENLSARILAALACRGLPASALQLEITETALMSSPNRAKAALQELADAGIALSIDDFGTGFTSFKYLREFDIAEIKLDRMFITDIQAGGRDASIVRSVAALTNGFGTRFVAEGIEALDTVPLLAALGCQIGQGYGICRPVSADALLSWWTEWTRSPGIGGASCPRC